MPACAPVSAAWPTGPTPSSTYSYWSRRSANPPTPFPGHSTSTAAPGPSVPPEAFRPAARPWLTAGFRVVLPSYRRPPRVTLPGIVADCRTALAFTAAFATQTGRPVTAPHVGGISAGGHLAALTALHPAWWTNAGWPAPPDRALICAAPLDLALLSPRSLFDRYSELSPTAKVKQAEKINWLLLHGTADGMVDYRHALRFTEALHLAGHAHRLLTIPGGGHLDAGRWTYDDQDPHAAPIAAFIRSR